MTQTCKLIQICQKRDILKQVKRKQISVQKEKLDSLHIQSLLFNAICSVVSARELEKWCQRICLMTPSIANFARKALIRCLPTQSNLFRWGRAPTEMCPNCHNLETERHVLNNCPISALQGRYTWRHNAVIRHLVSIIESKLSQGSVLYVDLPGFSNPDAIFNSMRPDITIVNGSTVRVLELTCCYEFF